MTAVASATIMGDSMLYNVLPSRVEAFGVSVALVGVLLSANRVVRLFSNSVAAWAIERFGMRGPLLGSVLLALGTTVTYGTASWFWVLLLARLLWGMTFSVFRLSGYLVVLDESVEGNRGRLMGFFTSGMRTGSIVGVLLGGLLFDVTGRATSFLVIAALGLTGLPAALALVRGQVSFGRVVRSSDHSDGAALRIEKPDANAVGDAGLRRRIWDVLISSAPELDAGQRRLILSASFTFFSFQLVMNGVLISSLGYFLNQSIGTEAAIVGVVIGVATLNGALISLRWLSGLAAPYFGHLGDRYGRGRILAVALPVCLVALVLLASPVPFWIVVAWLPFAFGATAASITALDSFVGGMAPPARRAQIMSRYATWQDSGSAIGPLLAFAVLGFTSLTFVYLGGAVLLAFALGLFLFMSRIRSGKVMTEAG